MIFKNKNIDIQKIKRIFLSILFLIFILSSVLLTRNIQEKPDFPAGESYYHLRIAEELKQDSFYDNDLVQKTPYAKEPYHMALAFLLKLGLPHILIPILFGILSGTLFYILLVQLGFAEKNGAFAMMLLGFTPIFIISFSSLSKLGFIILLSLACATLFFSKNYWAYPWKISGKISFMLSMICLVILSLTSFFAFLIAVFFLFMLSLYSSKNVRAVVLVLTPAILVVISNIIFNNYLPVLLNSFDIQSLSLKESFSVLGSSFGLDIFMTLFFIIGFIVLWSHFSQTRLYHLLILFFIIVSLFSETLRIYSSLIMVVYCVVALKHLYYRKWELEVIKSGTVLLLVCALIFSALSQMTILIHSEPSIESLSALQELKSYPSGVVFSQKELLSSIQFFSSKQTLLSENYERDELTEYLSLVGTVRLSEARDLIEGNKIKYFLITPSMKEDFWNNKEIELLFLLHHSDSFAKRYDWKGYEIWEYREQERILG